MESYIKNKKSGVGSNRNVYLLFNIYSEEMFSEAFEDIQEGIKINKVAINNIKYTEDTVILVNCLDVLQKLLERLVGIGEKYDFELNSVKNNCMVISKKPKAIKRGILTVNDVTLRKVDLYILWMSFK